ncbi:MAG TPA: hypothetical protein VNV63_05250 [Nitrospiria bacterium]|nr:hypothetical protein [Nitrospiria bacterium]
MIWYVVASLWQQYEINRSKLSGLPTLEFAMDIWPFDPHTKRVLLLYLVQRPPAPEDALLAIHRFEKGDPYAPEAKNLERIYQTARNFELGRQWIRFP